MFDPTLHASHEMASDELVPFVLENVKGLDSSEKKGSGAYGAVYEVTVNGISCIAKRIHDILVTQVSPRERTSVHRKFVAECVLLSKLRHPNVVHFVGVHYGRSANDLSLVMECLHTDLANYLEDSSSEIPLSIKLSILLDVSYGLVYFHTQTPPIIHRDLTASNVLLTTDLRAKIADLGVAKLLDHQTQAAIIQIRAQGTQDYMPLEALQENPVYNWKLDIFSFGHLALYVVAQKLPVVHELTDKAMYAALQQNTVQIQRRRTTIEQIGGETHTLYPLITQCLQDKVERRPTTTELNDSLKELCTKHPWSMAGVVTQADKVFCKSRIFYYKSHENPYQYYKSRENLHQVLQVTCAVSERAMKSKAENDEDLLDMKRKQEGYRSEDDTAWKQVKTLQEQLVQEKAEVERGHNLIACYEKRIQELEAVVAITDRKHEAQIQTLRKILAEDVLTNKKMEYQAQVQAFSEPDQSSSIEQMETTNQANKNVPSQQQTQPPSQNFFAAPWSNATSQPSGFLNFNPVRKTAAGMTQGSNSISFGSFPLAFGQSGNSAIPATQVLGGTDRGAPPQVSTWKEGSPLLSTSNQDSNYKISSSSSDSNTGFNFSTAGMNLNFSMTGTNVVPVFNSGGSAESRIVRKARRRKS